jgi:hypothetical protein
VKRILETRRRRTANPHPSRTSKDGSGVAISGDGTDVAIFATAIPTWISLALIVGALAVSIFASLLAKQKSENLYSR